MGQGKIHQQFCFLARNQRSRGRLEQQVPPWTKPDQMLQRNVVVKMALPKFTEDIEGLHHRDRARRIQQQPLEACPGNTTCKINQPIEICRSPTSSELLAPPLQEISARQRSAVCQGRRLRQCSPDSHSNSPWHSRASS